MALPKSRLTTAVRLENFEWLISNDVHPELALESLNERPEPFGKLCRTHGREDLAELVSPIISQERQRKIKRGERQPQKKSPEALKRHAANRRKTWGL